MPNIYIFLTIVMSSLIKGVTGFGFALLSLPILLMWYEPVEIIPVLMVCNLVASLFIVLQKKKNKLIDKPSKLLLVSGGLFTILGVVVLKHVDADVLIHFAGFFFIGLTILSLFNRRPKRAVALHTYPIVGSIIGLITGVISISGPPLALFLNRANVDNKKFREIFAWFSIVTATIAIIGYTQMGMFTNQVIKLSLMFIPILLVGSLVGKYLNEIISIQSFKAVNILLTLISCVLLLSN
ncbi:MAG: hypothetical protein C0599_15675 [Salinivirgaceae bacterium]|nr:MAG: hypothetical protein C0599_15675 [Salinivirgaceae bacterium]